MWQLVNYRLRSLDDFPPGQSYRPLHCGMYCDNIAIGQPLGPMLLDGTFAWALDSPIIIEIKDKLCRNCKSKAPLSLLAEVRNATVKHTCLFYGRLLGVFSFHSVPVPGPRIFSQNFIYPADFNAMARCSRIFAMITVSSSHFRQVALR